jgi:hypothetical protein
MMPIYLIIRGWGVEINSQEKKPAIRRGHGLGDFRN